MKTVIYLDELLLTNFLAAAMLLFVYRAAVCTAVQRPAPAGRQCGSGGLLPWHPAAGAARCGGGALQSLYLRCRCGRRLWCARPAQLCPAVRVVSAAESAAVRGGSAARRAEREPLRVLCPLSPGRLLLCCGAVSALLRAVLFCFGRAGPRSVAAVLELDGAALPVQALCDTGFSVQDPLSGRAVVVLHYPSVRDGLPQALRTFLDSYFACGTAPSPELGVRLVPCTTIAGHCVLPAVPAKALRVGSRRVQGFLAAFCRPETPPEHWTALLDSELAGQLGIH